MAFKLMIFAVGIAVTSAGLIAAPAVAAVRAFDDYDPNPQYSYAYDVRDALTGDNKSQQESRSGDVVQGQYSLVESDGTRRIVDYTADDVNGFNAVVRKEGLHAVAAPVVAGPAVVAARVAAPLAVAHPAPLTYAAHAAPLAYAAHAAPLAYAAHPAPFAPLARFAAPVAHTSFGLAHPGIAPVARIASPYATYIH